MSLITFLRPQVKMAITDEKKIGLFEERETYLSQSVTYSFAGCNEHSSTADGCHTENMHLTVWIKKKRCATWVWFHPLSRTYLESDRTFSKDGIIYSHKGKKITVAMQ